MDIQEFIKDSQIREDPLKLFWAIIEIAAKRLNGTQTVEGLRSAALIHDDHVKLLLEGAADVLLKKGRQGRYDDIVALLDRHSENSRSIDFWMQKGASDQLVAISQGVRSVRFSFPFSLRPWLSFAMSAVENNHDVQIHFLPWHQPIEHVSRDLKTVLELSNVTIDVMSPWDRSECSDVELEVMMPPFGPSVTAPEWLAEKVEKHSRSGRLNAETLSIITCLERLDTRAFIIASEGELFRMVGAEATMRRELIESGQLQAVLNAPSGLFYTSTPIKTALLILSAADDTRETVRFVDMSHEQVTHRGARGRFEFNQDADINELAFGEAQADMMLARDVAYDEIVDQNHVLTPERYLNTGPRRLIDAFLNESEAADLAEVVDLVRPVNLPKSHGQKWTIYEASPGDVDKRGYLQKPARSFSVDQTTFGERALKQQVQAGDVLISIKGTIGVVGLVPEDVTMKAEHSVWTAGQSLMILRPKKRRRIDPIVLYEYLTADAVQEFIKSLAGGSTIQNIAMKDLKTFQVPVPAEQITEEVKAGFEKRQALFDEVEALEQQIAANRAQQWPHAQLGLT